MARCYDKSIQLCQIFIHLIGVFCFVWFTHTFAAFFTPPCLCMLWVRQQLNIPRSISSLVQFMRPFANKAFSIDRHTTTSLQTCIIFVANNKFFHIEFQSDLIYSRGYIKLLPMQLELSAQCGQIENFQIWIIIHWSMSWNFQKFSNSTASYKSTERADKTLGKLTQKKFK